MSSASASNSSAIARSCGSSIGASLTTATDPSNPWTRSHIAEPHEYTSIFAGKLLAAASINIGGWATCGSAYFRVSSEIHLLSHRPVSPRDIADVARRNPAQTPWQVGRTTVTVGTNYPARGVAVQRLLVGSVGTRLPAML
jgi:hypothetical protein